MDSKQMGDARRRELRVEFDQAIELGRSAVACTERGSYTNAYGMKVDIVDQVKHAIQSKESIPPTKVLRPRAKANNPRTVIQVINATALQAASHLTLQSKRPLALNFANGIEPGGGFLIGSQAQEEVLCRSSALYATLENDPMYAYHLSNHHYESSDWTIYSPDVPVFRNDDGTPLENPWLCSFITCAAPYAPNVGIDRSAEILKGRIHRVLEVAHAKGYEALVLGAWGCGAFGNDPHRIALHFREALAGPFLGYFSDVVFAITDWSPERRFLGSFRDVLK
jgi:uncharacterized protein (TIGR02452 family)